MRATATWILRLLLVLGIVVVIAIAYLHFGNLSRHAGSVEGFLSDAVGHDVVFEGDFDIDVGESTTFSANSIVIRNPAWDNQQDFVRIGFARIVVDTWSVFEESIVIQQLEIEDLTLDLATDEAGAGNWEPAATISGAGDDTPFEMGIESLTLTGLNVGLNEHSANLNGEIRAALGVAFAGTPHINVDLNAVSLELVTVSPDADVATPTDSLVFDDVSFDTEIFNLLSSEISVEIGQLELKSSSLNNIVLEASFDKTGLTVSPLSFDSHNGSTTIVAEFVPEDDEITMQTTVDAAGLRLGSLWSDEASFESLPQTSGTLKVTGRGSSWHQIVNAGVGSLDVVQDSGRLKEVAAAGLFGDVIVQVFETLNPLSSDKAFTDLECAFYTIDLAGGIATVSDLRAQTDDMMIVGSGKVRLDDESIDISVRAKPREGLGISLGGVANSFVKLGGHLRSPELQLDAASGATTTGAAVATGGISLLARSLWDRLSAVNDICPEAVDE